MVRYEKKNVWHQNTKFGVISTPNLVSWLEMSSMTSQALTTQVIEAVGFGVVILFSLMNINFFRLKTILHMSAALTVNKSKE